MDTMISARMVDAAYAVTATATASR
jgi:hypothetical protein